MTDEPSFFATSLTATAGVASSSSSLESVSLELLSDDSAFFTGVLFSTFFSFLPSSSLSLEELLLSDSSFFLAALSLTTTALGFASPSSSSSLLSLLSEVSLLLESPFFLSTTFVSPDLDFANTAFLTEDEADDELEEEELLEEDVEESSSSSSSFFLATPFADDDDVAADAFTSCISNLSTNFLPSSVILSAVPYKTIKSSFSAEILLAYALLQPEMEVRWERMA
mmetsp:Transcript_2734/g.6256  ORF Transcript_2734/g.6256 Transcript_2734/m.6256 type:complete len:226 (+) Transcript_2734:1066-1743(+)